MTPSLVMSSHPHPPQSPYRAGYFQGYSGFQLIPRDLCVGPVPYSLHSALSKEIRPSRCACLCHSPLQYLWVSLTSPALPSALPKLPVPHGLVPASFPVTPVLLHASPRPFPVISHPSAHLPRFSYLLCLSSLPASLSRSPFLIPHYPRIPYFPCLAYPRPLTRFLIPLSVRVCRAISNGEQGFIVGSVWQCEV